MCSQTFQHLYGVQICQRSCRILIVQVYLMNETEKERFRPLTTINEYNAGCVNSCVILLPSANLGGKGRQPAQFSDSFFQIIVYKFSYSPQYGFRIAFSIFPVLFPNVLCEVKNLKPGFSGNSVKVPTNVVPYFLSKIQYIRFETGLLLLFSR